MTPQDTRHLNELLHIFGAASLGEGDPVAGVNLLAAMATSIANISPPGSGLQAPNGETLHAGASFLVSGSHGTSLIAEKVLADLGDRQNNLNSHLRAHVRNLPTKTKAVGGLAEDPRVAFMDQYNNLTLEGLYADGDFHRGGVAGPWAGLLRQPAAADFEELRDQHVIFAAKGATGNLADILDHAHRGRPCLHVELDKAPHFARVARQCLDVMDGRGSTGLNSQTVRGTVIATDPSGILGEAMRAEGAAGQLVSRMILLVDGNAGPEPGEPEANTKLVALDSLGMRYRTAMEEAWGSRLDHRKPGPVLLSYEFQSFQSRWTSFLRTKEAEFPGITGTARNLFATLLFGIDRLMNSTRTPEGFKCDIAQVEALARFLVHRMANARSAILYSAQSARRLVLEEKILQKLQAGPLDVRGITRKSHNLPADQCREMLFDMEADGRVLRIGDRLWQARESTNSATSSPLHLTLEA
jgi:hypothetical protein